MCYEFSHNMSKSRQSRRKNQNKLQNECVCTSLSGWLDVQLMKDVSCYPPSKSNMSHRRFDSTGIISRYIHKRLYTWTREIKKKDKYVWKSLDKTLVITLDSYSVWFLGRKKKRTIDLCWIWLWSICLLSLETKMM